MKIIKLLLKAFTVLLGAAWAIAGFILGVIFDSFDAEDDEDRMTPYPSPYDPYYGRKVPESPEEAYLNAYYMDDDDY